MKAKSKIALAQVYVNCINFIVNLILPTLILGVLNYFVYKVMSKNQTQGKEMRRTNVMTENKLRKRDIRYGCKNTQACAFYSFNKRLPEIK